MRVIKSIFKDAMALYYVFNLNLLLYKRYHCWLPVLEGASLLEASQHASHLSQTKAAVASLQRRSHKNPLQPNETTVAKQTETSQTSCTFESDHLPGLCFR